MPYCGCGWEQPDVLSVAVAEGDAEAVRELLTADVRRVRQPIAKARQNAWHVAAAAGHVRILQLLVGTVQGASEQSLSQLSSSLRKLVNMGPLTAEQLLHKLIHQADASGMTPLLLAAREGHEAAVAYLLGLGADLWQHDQTGLTALHHAARMGHVLCIQELLANPVPPTAEACSVNHPTTKYVDCIDIVGWAPLHYAVYKGHLEAAATLVSMDANIIARTLVFHHVMSSLPPGCSPLHIAASQGNLFMIQLILRAYYESSADLVPNLLATVERRRRQRSQPDPRLILSRTGRLAFHVALRFGHREVLEWLDPSIPLMFLLSGSDDVAATAAGQQAGSGAAGGSLAAVPRLTVLAAKALHLLLVNSLEKLEQELEARKKQQEQQKLAEAGKATLVRQVQRFRAMLSKVVAGRTEAASPGAQDLMATAPLPGRAASRPTSRISSRTLPSPPSATGPSAMRPSVPRRPRGQRRLLVQASARREGAGVGGAARASGSRLVQLLATGINFERQSDYADQNVRMGIAIPNNPAEDPVAVLTRSAANTMNGQQVLTAVPMRLSPAAAVAASQATTSQDTDGEAAQGNEGGSPGGRRQSRHNMAHDRHSDPGSLQHMRDAVTGGTFGSSAAVAAATSGMTTSPAASPRHLSYMAGPSTCSPRGSAHLTSRLCSAGYEGIAVPGAALPQGAGSGSGIGGSGSGTFCRVSILNNVVPTTPDGHTLSLGASGLSRSTRHSEPGKPGDFSFAIVPAGDSCESVGPDQLCSRASGNAQDLSIANAPEDAASIHCLSQPEAQRQDGDGDAVGALLPAAGEIENKASSSAEHAGPQTAAQSEVVLASQPPATESAEASHAMDIRSGGASLCAPNSQDAGLSIVPQEAVLGEGQLSGGELPGALNSAAAAVTSMSAQPAPESLPLLDLPGLVVDEATGSAAPQSVHSSTVEGIMGDAGPDRFSSQSTSRLAARTSKSYASAVAASKGADPTAAALPAPAYLSSTASAVTSEGAAETPSGLLVQDQSQLHHPPPDDEASAAAASEGEGLSGLLTSIRKHLKKMSVQVVPSRSPVKARSVGFERRTKSFTQEPQARLDMTDLSDVGSDAGSIADQAVVGGAEGSTEDVEEDVCPVCLDQPPNVQVAKCRHKLCLGCAKDLCNRYHLTPALCPYCRSVIAGFSPAG